MPPIRDRYPFVTGFLRSIAVHFCNECYVVTRIILLIDGLILLVGVAVVVVVNLRVLNLNGEACQVDEAISTAFMQWQMKDTLVIGVAFDASVIWECRDSMPIKFSWLLSRIYADYAS